MADAALQEARGDSGTALALKCRAQASLALAQHLRGNVEAAERLFVEANSEQENFSDDSVFGSGEPSRHQKFLGNRGDSEGYRDDSFFLRALKFAE